MVPEAKKLVGAKEGLQTVCVTQVVIECNGQKFTAPMVMDAPAVDVNNPCFDYVARVPLTTEIAAAAPEIKITLNNKGSAIGEYTIPFADVLSAPGLSLEQQFTVEAGGCLNANVAS